MHKCLQKITITEQHKVIIIFSQIWVHILGPWGLCKMTLKCSPRSKPLIRRTRVTPNSGAPILIWNASHLGEHLGNLFSQFNMAFYISDQATSGKILSFFFSIKPIFQITTWCKWPILREFTFFAPWLLMLFHYWHTLCPLGLRIHHLGITELPAIILIWYHTVSACLFPKLRKKKKPPLIICSLSRLACLMCFSVSISLLRYVSHITHYQRLFW